MNSWTELTSKEKIDLVAQLMGYEKLHVGYFGAHGWDDKDNDETPRQVELQRWMLKVGLRDIGDFYIDVKSDFWIKTINYHPLSDMNTTMQVAEKMRSWIVADNAWDANLLTLSHNDLDSWSASFDMHNPWEDWEEWWDHVEEFKYSATATTPTEAICHAACLAMGLVKR